MRHVGPPPGDSASLYDGAGLLKERGDFFWLTPPAHPQGRVLVFAMPIQRHGQDDGQAWTHSHWTIDHPNQSDAQWEWDGNEDAPTLSPSLHAVGIWHGFVKGGILSE